MVSLKQLALKGAIWTFIGYGASQLVRLASNLILTRLLVPELFGLMALVYTFITGLTLFSDIGVGASIIQNKRGGESNFINTAWTVQVIRGLALWLICLILTWPVANLYEEPRLLWIFPIIGFTMVLTGLESTANFTLNREVAMGKVMMFEIGIQVISTVTIVVWALISPTIWALVGGNLVGASLKTIISHTLLPQETPNRFHWDKTALDEIISFGKWIFLSTAMTFLATQSDRLLLGKFFPLEFLGIYSIAFTLGDLPRNVNGRVYGRVLFPIISKIADTPRPELRQKIMKSRQLALGGLMLIVVVLAGLGDIIVDFLYSDEYSSAGWILALIALGLWPNLLADTLSPCLFAIGKPNPIATGNFFSFLLILIGIPLSFYLLPAPLAPFGAVVTVSLSELPFYVAITMGLVRERLSCFRQDLVMTGVLIVVLGTVLGVRLLLGLGWPLDNILI